MFGFILIGVGIVIGYVSGLFQKVPRQKRVVGKIAKLEPKGQSLSGKPKQKAYVEYLVNGHWYVVSSKRYSCSYRLGKKMVVAYNELQPREAILCAAPGSTFLVLGLVFVGILVVLGGLV